MSKIQSLNYQNKPNLERIQNNLAPRQNYRISFGQEKDSTSKTENENSSHLSFKHLTNILGVAAWLGVVGYSLVSLKLLQRKSPEMIAEGAKNLKKQALSHIEKLADPEANNIDKALGGVPSKGLRKFLYKMGDGFQNLKMKLGSELFNNLTYAFGTLVIMPAVVLFSPIGKKDASKEDKMFAVLRQPLSVAATLGMQYTFDKLIDKNVPAALKKNQLEDKSILDEKGKIKLTEESFEKIKYNSDSAKEIFKNLAKDTLTDKEIKNLFDLKSFEDDSSSIYKTKMKEILNEKYKNLNLKSVDDIIHGKEAFLNFKKTNAKDASNIEKIITKFNKFTSVLDNNKMAVQKSKTMVNVLAASAIGCTFLNVIYGKAMKAYKQYKDANMSQPDKNAKEVK